MRPGGKSRLRLWPLAALVLCGVLAARADDTPPADTPPSEADTSQIGRSIFVANEVDGQYGDAPAARLAVNDNIVFEEDITTGADAKTIIEFRDGSTFEVGPDAVVRIDSFIFNPEESTSQKTVQVTRGVFRYVSGYVAGNQETKIATPRGILGIRGSVAEGVVDPDVPDFVYIGEGNATFTNTAGSTDLTPGNAIAVPSPDTPPMAPAAMPPAVAAQALQVIEKRLPPREAARSRPTDDEAWLRRAGAANLVATRVQQERAAAILRGRPLPAPAARGTLGAELGLLVEGNRVNLFAGRQTARTPAQSAFLTRTAREHPNAAATLLRFNNEARVLHAARAAEGTRFVIGGVARAAPSAAVLKRVTAASVRANPGAAGLINRQATETFSHRANIAPGRPSPSGPSLHAPPEHGPNAHAPPEHGQNVRTPPEHGRNIHAPPGRGPNAHAPPEHQERRPGPPQQQQQRTLPGKATPKPPPQKQPPGKQPPKKKGEEQNQQR